MVRMTGGVGMARVLHDTLVMNQSRAFMWTRPLLTRVTITAPTTATRATVACEAWPRAWASGSIEWLAMNEFSQHSPQSQSSGVISVERRSCGIEAHARWPRKSEHVFLSVMHGLEQEEAALGGRRRDGVLSGYPLGGPCFWRIL